MSDGVDGTIPLLAQRAASEGPRWTRAVGIIPSTPPKGQLAAALPAERRVLARRGWAGEKSGPFEHPAALLPSASTWKIPTVYCV